MLLYEESAKVVAYSLRIDISCSEKLPALVAFYVNADHRMDQILHSVNHEEIPLN